MNFVSCKAANTDRKIKNIMSTKSIRIYSDILFGPEKNNIFFRRYVFGSQSKILLYASLSKIGNVAGCIVGAMIFLIATSILSR